MLTNVMIFSTQVEKAPLSDDEILARSSSQPELFAELVRRFEAPFLRRARSILNSPEDAEEVVQDAFTKIYLYADRYKPQEGASFSSWAYTILNRVAYTKYGIRKKEWGKTAELTTEHFESFADKRADFLEDLSIRDEVLSALATLPENASRILSLQFIEGKTQQEIAKAEDMTVPAVKTRVHRAKKLFKKAYDEQRHD